jgi:hypothetical protein
MITMTIRVKLILKAFWYTVSILVGAFSLSVTVLAVAANQNLAVCTLWGGLIFGIVAVLTRELNKREALHTQYAHERSAVAAPSHTPALAEYALGTHSEHLHTTEKGRALWDEGVLRYSLLTQEDQAIYMRLVNVPRWRERADECREQVKSTFYNLRSPIFPLFLWLSTLIRGRYFHADRKRAKRIQNFLNDTQVKYDSDSIDHTDFPGFERWQ